MSTNKTKFKFNKHLCLSTEFYSMKRISICPGSAYINCSCQYVGFDFMKSIYIIYESYTFTYFRLGQLFYWHLLVVYDCLDL